ncbi:unnamed protein product [Ceutorhynchus assimilis]|uniref:Helitron helicase-like domain-containing protein n=1 Tax=Ceutorhynchus assimilis TaxID=467358 RepID=A0A9N9MZG2_9CUCU|nr:unnamed protein product [Ceutorhynchus assimilis]
MVRSGEVNYLLYFRAPFSQFMVDMYGKIESQQLKYIKMNQEKLKAENYIHLKDAVGRQDVEANQVKLLFFHLHLLVVLDKIDQTISAEIPDLHKDSILYEIIKSNMIHGLCGNIDLKSSCMKDGVCSKRYP